MRRRAFGLVLVLLLSSVALAGCADGPDDGGDAPPGPTETPDPSPTRASGGSRELVAGSRPIWYPGLQWTYEVDSPEVGIKGDLTLVVVREDEDVWQVAPANDSAPEAIFWGLFWHLPPMGAVSTETFSPHVHGETLQWFDFPLRHGKTWQAPDHHGTDVNYTAMATETVLFDGRTVTAFEVTGERNGVTWLRYVYTAEVAWFTEAEVDGDGDGVVDHKVTLTDVRPGAAHLTTPMFEAIEVASLADRGPRSVLDPATSFTVPEGAGSLFVFFVLGGGPGHYTGSVTLPSDRVESFNFTNTNQTPMAVVRGGAFEVGAGEGDVGSMVAGDGFVFAEVFAVTRGPA